MAQPVEHAFAINPEIDSFDELHQPAITKINGNQVTYRAFSATSVSPNAIQWQVQPPSFDTYMNRAIQKVVPLTITFTGVSSGLLLADGYDALRSLPILRCTTNEVISINGAGFPTSQNFEIHPDLILHYNQSYRERHPLCAPDVTQQYIDAVASIANPLANYANSDIVGGSLKRGSYVAQVGSITRTETTASVSVDLVEWIHVPGLLGLDQIKQTGLCRLRSFDVNSAISLEPSKIWSSADSGTSPSFVSQVQSVSIALRGTPQLICKFISPPAELVPHGVLKYKHFRMERFSTGVNVPTIPNAQVPITGNNIQLPVVPKYMYVFVREADAQKTFKSTDTFLRLDDVSVNFNNQTGLLSGTPLSAMWEISRECGLLDSYPMFAGLSRNQDFSVVGTSGSLFCAEFGRHISLGGNSISVGSTGSFNFNVTVRATNVNQVSTIVNPTLYVIVAYEQVLALGDGGEVAFETPVVANGVMAFGPEGPVQVMYDMDGMYGGGIKEVFQKIGAWLRKTKLLSTIGKIVGPMIPNATGQTIASLVTGAIDKSGYGAGADGGAVISRRELKKMIKAL